jgi:hypothetical protein
MKRNILLPTTEQMIWVSLPFRISPDDRELTWMQARRRAVKYRVAGRLARVRPDPDFGGYMVATYKPRRNAPRRCDLKA